MAFGTRLFSKPEVYGNLTGVEDMVFVKYTVIKHHRLDQGRRNEKRARGADFVEGHRQNFDYVKIHTLEFRGSVAFFLRQILTYHILSIASAIRLDINTNSIDIVTAGYIITN